MSSAWAQAQPAPEAPATPAAAPAVKKQSPNKAAAKPYVPAANGPCDLGVIAAAGTPIGLKKIGITVFGNEYSEVPFDAWGIDDLIVARVRAAAGTGIAVRRIAYAKDSFESYRQPEKRLIRDARENFVSIVRQIATNSRCARYIVVIGSVGSYPRTNQVLSGVGVTTRGPFRHAAVFALLSA